MQGLQIKDGPGRLANADQEAWVQARILTAMRMAVAIHQKAGPRADEHMVDFGFRGVAEGAALEVIRTLGMQPEFINIRNPNPPAASLLNAGKSQGGT